jgi:hypothetical protein
MTDWTDTPHDFIPGECNRVSWKICSQTIPGAAALALTGMFGVWILYVRPAAVPNAVEVSAVRSAATPADTPAATAASNPYGALFDPTFTSGSTPVSLAQSFPLEAGLESKFEAIPPAPSAATAEPEDIPPPAVPKVVQNVPLPTPRPPDFGLPASHNRLPASGRRLAQQNRKTAVATISTDNRTFFEKFFGTLQQPSGPVLAYAAPEEGVLSNSRRTTPGPLLPYDRSTAVYDIAAHTVYLPDGTRLEAHSGLGNRLDDPRYVNERMRGATPPNVYELQPREQLFHGVRALRLIPVGNGSVYGRTGLLAHTYMLGPNGDSNGCVSFRNYNAFLRAYQNGEIKRLAVVARLN